MAAIYARNGQGWDGKGGSVTPASALQNRRSRVRILSPLFHPTHEFGLSEPILGGRRAFLLSDCERSPIAVHRKRRPASVTVVALLSLPGR